MGYLQTDLQIPCVVSVWQIENFQKFFEIDLLEKYFNIIKNTIDTFRITIRTMILISGNILSDQIMQ